MERTSQARGRQGRSISAARLAAAALFATAVVLASSGTAWAICGKDCICGSWNNYCRGGGDGTTLPDRSPTPPTRDPTVEAAHAAFAEGRRATQEGRYADAEAAYRRVIALTPDDKNAWYNLGNNILRQNSGSRINEAIAAFDESGRHGNSDGTAEAERLREWLAEQNRLRRVAEEEARRQQTEAEDARRKRLEQDEAQRRRATEAVPDAIKDLVDDFVRETGSAPPAGELANPPSLASLSPPPPADGTTAPPSDTLPVVHPADIKGPKPKDTLRVTPPPPPKPVNPVFDPAKPAKEYGPRPEDIRRLGPRAGDMVMDAIQKGRNNPNQSKRILEDHLRMAPADPDLRDASSYIIGMSIGRDITGNLGRPLSPADLARLNRPTPGLDSVPASVFGPRMSDLTNLKRWEDQRNQAVSAAMDRHNSDIAAALADLEAQARRKPDDDVARGALRVMQGIAVFTESNSTGAGGR